MKVCDPNTFVTLTLPIGSIDKRQVLLLQLWGRGNLQIGSPQ